MTSESEQLVRETMELTGAESPALLDERAPVLATSALARDDADGFYLVGLIGGKDVGKSSLVNALVGSDITAITSYGPGTESIIAYAHRTQERDLRSMLDRESPGQFRIVSHDIAALRRQVLLDLPDIDSHYESHVQLTRRMLRHMLYPIWIQSVEKYADRTPQKMLAAVAEGNSPANFIFCLNKVDQIDREAASTLAEDYARRIGALLHIETPIVHLISAVRADQFELPKLRETIAHERSSSAVKISKELAADQQDRSIVFWLDQQNLPARLDRAKRLEEDAGEIVIGRVGQPLLDIASELQMEPGHRFSMIDAAMSERVARWPIVNLVHTLLSPLLGLAQRNVASSFGGVEGVVEDRLGASGSNISSLVRSSFAHLQQTHRPMSDLYKNRKLWDDHPPDAAVAELRQRFAGAMRRQQETIHQCVAGRFAWMGTPIRWLLTIGALLWFPIVQPILEASLQKSIGSSAREIGLLVVQIMGTTYLLKNLIFLAGYFVVLWLILRWDTQRRVTKCIGRWLHVNDGDGLGKHVFEWTEGLLEPIRRARQRIEALNGRVEEFRSRVSGPRSVAGPSAEAKSLPRSAAESPTSAGSR